MVVAETKKWQFCHSSLSVSKYGRPRATNLELFRPIVDSILENWKPANISKDILTLEVLKQEYNHAYEY